MIKYFRIGIITKPHGLKGEFNVFVTCDNIDRYYNLKSIYLIPQNLNLETINNVDDYEYNIENIKKFKNTIIIKLKNYDTIESIEKFRNYEIYIDRKFSEKLKDNEYYVPDLIGLDIYDEEDKFISKVVSVEQNLANSNLVIDYNNEQLLIPLIKDFIESIDLENKKIVLKNTKGLFLNDI